MFTKIICIWKRLSSIEKSASNLQKPPAPSKIPGYPLKKGMILFYLKTTTWNFCIPYFDVKLQKNSLIIVTTFFTYL